MMRGGVVGLAMITIGLVWTGLLIGCDGQGSESVAGASVSAEGFGAELRMETDRSSVTMADRLGVVVRVIAGLDQRVTGFEFVPEDEGWRVVQEFPEAISIREGRRVVERRFELEPPLIDLGTEREVVLPSVRVRLTEGGPEVSSNDGEASLSTEPLTIVARSVLADSDAAILENFEPSVLDPGASWIEPAASDGPHQWIGLVGVVVLLASLALVVGLRARGRRPGDEISVEQRLLAFAESDQRECDADEAAALLHAMSAERPADGFEEIAERLDRVRFDPARTASDQQVREAIDSAAAQIRLREREEAGAPV